MNHTICDIHCEGVGGESAHKTSQCKSGVVLSWKSDVDLQECVKCTFTSISKQAIYSTRWELAESIICGCKNCTRIVSGAIQKACQLSSIKEPLEGAECISAIEDTSNAITREESKGVNNMNDAILGLAEVSLCQFCSTDERLLHKRKKEVYTITKH